MAVTTYIVDKDGNQANAASVTVPSDRNFRGAWTLSGKSPTLGYDRARSSGSKPGAANTTSSI